ncbi:protein-L-isoaspartate(D-aspartate) O-methyltransferase [Chthonobacter albigriseus]|uniref:protein-L-isoaspartate(D-aspartate) O-methyltransferase n=1 Tax=Chthonobacter albigriseus TaxID=1683161 RepID=UPI0015EEDEF2|nr:protein-L-isoaspartate(D-aspartate) O-methyltransferase [Chthonobacter albigriseus]
MKPADSDRAGAEKLARRVAEQGVTDERILAAIAAVPRRIFLAAAYQASAYADRALPIECGQTISPPSTTAMLVAALDLKPEHKLLEIGTGSGYQTVLLARLAAAVVTLERFRTLTDLAADRFALLKVPNVQAFHADGFDGYPRHAPYDRILLDGAVSRIPHPVLDQLADRGLLVAPVGTGPEQTLVRVVRDGRLFHRTELGPVRFTPLVEGLAARL